MFLVHFYLFLFLINIYLFKKGEILFEIKNYNNMLFKNNQFTSEENNVFEDHRRNIHHHNIISAAILEQSMTFIGCYKYGTANQKLGAFFDEEDGNTTKFTVYMLIIQPGVVNPAEKYADRRYRLQESCASL